MRKLALILLVVSLVSGCNGVGTRKKGEGLVTAMDEYVAALRWGRFERAQQFHLNPDGSTPEIDSSQLEYIRVTGHRTRRKSINDTVNEAQVELELQYYHNEYGTLKKLPVRQTWWYSEEHKGWYLSSDFPRF